MKIFVENPLLLLFIVAAIGYAIGNIKVKGINFGVSGVLFVGLFFGALNPEIKIPQIIVLLGLVVFVYTVGLQSATGFFRAFKLRGFKDMIFIACMLIISAILVYGVYHFLDLDKAMAAGIFAGATTNTPALASIIDIINNKVTDPTLASLYNENVVVGYSIAYPMAIIGILFSLVVFQKIFKVNFKEEAKKLKRDYPVERNTTNASVIIANPDIYGKSIRDLMKKYSWNIVFGRIKSSDVTSLTSWNTILNEGDEIMIVGDEEDLEGVIPILGHENEHKISFETSQYTQRRIFVSNPKVAGKSIASLNLTEHYNMIVTRVRRGDIDLIASNDTVIEMGDRVRIVCQRKDVEEISTIFGDSYDQISHVNLFSFGLGITIGLLIGMLEISFPGGFTFSLGYAGGPLVVSIILGGLRRTGPILWVLPYSANLTLRQFSLILLLAGIGINSGNSFISTFSSGNGLQIFGASLLVVIVSTALLLIIGYRILKIPFSILSGMAANQPAVLDFANDRAGNKLPNIGYTTILPVALILKILIAQFLFTFLT
ncbi:aspartate:alanine exchanger family transporter [Portibacter lacus]|uniref:Transporter n=1 Tax=Portibacter lacus TaxID=1099794 RepID=A0AA37WDR7_9BACT|nr:aspartate:alanine exchanger family transporter [Portibacter lacus]GLR16242.1 putative transporter [Portibacter lacus]